MFRSIITTRGVIFMSRIKNIRGKTFNKLKVIESFGRSNRDHSVLWLCQCDCGNTIFATHTQLKNGDIKSCGCLKRTVSRKYNRYEIEGDTVKVYDSKDNYTLIDLDDLEKIKPYYWFKSTGGYFCTVTGFKHKPRLLLHYFVFPQDIPKGYEVDHKDRRRFNNTKANLRLATRSENNINRTLSSRNTTGYTGVSFIKTKNKYRAYITINYKQKSLGLFDSAFSAYEARLKAEKELYKDFSSKVGD